MPCLFDSYTYPSLRGLSIIRLPKLLLSLQSISSTRYILLAQSSGSSLINISCIIVLTNTMKKPRCMTNNYENLNDSCTYIYIELATYFSGKNISDRIRSDQIRSVYAEDIARYLRAGLLV